MDILVPISMNVKHKKVNLNQVTTATATPTALTPRKVLRVNVELDSMEMESLAEVRLAFHIIIDRKRITEKHVPKTADFFSRCRRVFRFDTLS